MKKIIITIVIILVVVTIWYFYAPVRWTFGLRQPKDFYECEAMNGKIVGEYLEACTYKGKNYIIPPPTFQNF